MNQCGYSLRIIVFTVQTIKTTKRHVSYYIVYERKYKLYLQRHEQIFEQSIKWPLITISRMHALTFYINMDKYPKALKRIENTKRVSCILTMWSKREKA